jgi:hypothetical protein
VTLFQLAPRGGRDGIASETTAAPSARVAASGHLAAQATRHVRDEPPDAPRPQAPDPEALSDIRPSAGRLARHEEKLARQLNEEMAQLVPGSALPLAFDMEAFCRSMARMLLWTALTDQPGHVVVDVLRQAGGQHCLDGFPNDEYASVAHALVQSVRYLTDDWSASLGSAWVTFFLWARLHLLDGARVAALSRPSGDGHGPVAGDQAQAALNKSAGSPALADSLAR